MLYEAKKIVKETEKAVAVANELYIEAKETANYDLKELSGRQIEALRNGSALIWLPKSQVVIENDYVVDMPEWLASKNGFATIESVKKAQEKRIASETRYNNLVEFCKANNVKGARVGLKAKTLLEMISKAGLVYNY